MIEGLYFLEFGIILNILFSIIHFGLLTISFFKAGAVKTLEAVKHYERVNNELIHLLTTYNKPRLYLNLASMFVPFYHVWKILHIWLAYVPNAAYYELETLKNMDTIYHLKNKYKQDNEG